ncbi:MAG: hypothetical protein ACOX6H_04385 [Christensenellales bacterium]|jgi:hypothetical protein
MYKSKKYNTVLVLLVLIISMVVGISTGMTKIVPSFDDNLDNTGGGEFQEVKDLPPGTKKPGADAGAYERLAFAFKILEEGNGFTSVGQQAITAVNHTQYTYYKRYRAKEFDVVEEWYKLDGALSSLGMNQFITRHSDGNIMKNIKITNAANYNYNALTYNTENAEKYSFTVDNWLNEQNYMRVNNFFTTVNKSTSSLLFYDGKGYDKTYYTVKVSLDNSKLDKKFMALFDNIGIGSVKIGTIIVEFKIDKKTGFFLGFEVKGTLNASYLGMTADCSLIFKETYNSMNSSSVKAQIDNLYNKNFKDIA